MKNLVQQVKRTSGICDIPDSLIGTVSGPADRIESNDEVQLGAADHEDMGSGIACESTDEVYEDGDSYTVCISSPNSPSPEYTSSAHTVVGDFTGDIVDEIASGVFNVEPLAFKGVYVYCAVISIHKY